MSSSRTEAVSRITEWDAPTPEQFRSTIVPSGQPAVLRRVARHWPLVEAAVSHPHRAITMLAANAANAPVKVIRADPEEQGFFHYRSDGRTLNFIRGEAPFSEFLSALREHESCNHPYAIAAQGLPADAFAPNFAKAHPMPLVPETIRPRLWIGNASTVATHNDPIDNVAVVAVGRRRFTIFPPEAEADLYMGPLTPTPAGTPVSMVRVRTPDLHRYPRFAAALDCAQQAELGPGDAVFIPRDWFHNVEALEPINMLVNYWWNAADA